MILRRKPGRRQEEARRREEAKRRPRGGRRRQGGSQEEARRLLAGLPRNYLQRSKEILRDLKRS